MTSVAKFTDEIVYLTVQLEYQYGNVTEDKLGRGQSV